MYISRKCIALPGLGGAKRKKTMLTMLSAFVAASNDKVLVNSRLRQIPVHQKPVLHLNPEDPNARVTPIGAGHD